MEKIKLLLVEDERTLAGIIKDTLNEKGFEVRVAYNGVEGLELFKINTPDVVVTDIMMPNMDGLDFVKKIRVQNKEIPVLFLSARSSAEDVVEGFETGGNDYLKKPFAISELIIRVKSLLGRTLNVQKEKPRTVFHIGSFTFDSEMCLLNGEVITARESEILSALARSAGEIVPIHKLLMDIWGSDTYFNNRSLNVFISRLRHRLSADESVLIVNIRGVGYKLIEKHPNYL